MIFFSDNRSLQLILSAQPTANRVQRAFDGNDSNRCAKQQPRQKRRGAANRDQA
jgi:hypothetical protein